MWTHSRSTVRVAALILCCSFFELSLAAGAAPRTQAVDALSALDKWLAAGPNATGWSSYLDLPALRAELGKENAADPAVIELVVTRLSGGAPGLELVQFVKLREALANWSTELVVSKAGNLGDAVAQFEAKYQPITEQDVTQSKAALTSAIGALDRYLKPLGANGAAWKTYLRWNDLTAQVESPQPDMKTLAAIERLLIADQKGLELPVFANVGTALERYRLGLEARQDDVKTQYGAHIKALAEDLRQYSKEYSQERAAAVGTHLGWLETHAHVEPLVRMVRAAVSRPNIFGAASGRLVAIGIEQPVDDTMRVTDVILGTDISGSARTVGRLRARLVPSEDNATIETTLEATTQSRTVGYNGPATIQAAATTQLQGSKRIVLDEKGFASYPAVAKANTRSQILGVAAGRGGIIQRVATNRVYESKSEGEQIAGEHAAVKTRHRVDAQANGQLYESHINYLENFRNPLLRKREFPSILHFSSTADALLIKSLQANRNQLGAPNDAPAIKVDNDLAVQAHESYINQLANALLSGVTIKQDEVEGKLIELRGEVPEQLKSDEQRDPWEILMASTRPIIVKFYDNGFRFTFRGQRYTAGDMAIRAMDVTVDYKVEIDGHGAKAIRQGELQIFPPGFVPGKDTLKPREIGWREKLRKRFGKIFEPELKSDGLVLPGKWRDAGRLDLKQLHLNGGWAVLAWIESGEPAPPEDRPNKVARAAVTSTFAAARD